MKFLLIAPRFHTNLYYQVIALQNQGHQIRVLVLYHGKSEYYQDVDIQMLSLSWFSRMIGKCICLLKQTYLKNAIELRLEYPGNELKREIIKFRPDAILLKAYQDLLAIKTMWIAKKLNIKVLMITQTTFNHIKGSKVLFRLNILLFRKLKLHAFITPVLENYRVFKAAGIENIYYLPFVYPALESLPAKDYNNELKIISVGKFQKRKDQLLLIKAIEKLRLKYEIRLDLFGEIADKTYYQQIKSYVRQNYLTKYISIRNHIDYQEINQSYSNYHLFVLPAYEEPAAYSPVEAMANGLPVIVSNQCGTKCYIEEGKNGYIFEVKNLEDLIEKIEYIIFDKKVQLQFSKMSLELAKKYHNFNDFCRQIEKIVIL